MAPPSPTQVILLFVNYYGLSPFGELMPKPRRALDTTAFKTGKMSTVWFLSNYTKQS